MTRQTVHLAVYDTLADWEYGYAVSAINDPQYQHEPDRYQVVTVGPTREPVTTMGGVKIIPDMSIDELTPDQSAMLILAGAHTWFTANQEFSAAARRFLDAGVPVAAICGATYGLADAGLLDDREHASGSMEFLALSENYHGAEKFQNVPAHTDGPLITASPAAPLEFAREILATLELYRPDVLKAWYGFFSTGDAAQYYALMDAAGMS